MLMGARVIRYVGENVPRVDQSDKNTRAVMYTQYKDFCNDLSTSCDKKTCLEGADDRYPMKDGIEEPGSGNVWKFEEWNNVGGIYEGHNNHGNCHGGMSNCKNGE